MTAPFRSITLHQPAQIAFGNGCAIDAFTRFVRSHGSRRVLIVSSPSVRTRAESLGSAVRALGAVSDLIAGIPPEPTIAACESARDQAKRFSPDLVLAIGGGSVLDVAKVVAALHDEPRGVAEFFGIGSLQSRRTALVCVPTTSGTGSEVSPNALLYDEVSRTKKAIISPALVPDAAVVDPTLTTSLPPALTATTGIDALTHCLEAYANLAAHPIVDLYTLEGVRLIAANLPQAVNRGGDLAARSAVALGSLYGGLALGPVNTAGVHALAYPLGGDFHLAHGVSIALLLPHVVRFNTPAMPARYAALARALGADAASPDDVAASECADRLDRLMDTCHIRRRLGAHGIGRDALPRLADAALDVTRLLKNNPRPVTRNDALRIYEAAF